MAREAVKIPGYISVFGSWECMYACPGCYQAYAEKWKHNLGDKPRFMPLSTFKRIVDEFSPYRTKIGLYSPGENFLNPDVYDMITYAQEQGCPVECDTTGAPMDPERLAATGINDIIVSIDGMTQEVYGAFRRNGNLENVQRRLEQFANAVERRGGKTNIIVKYLVNALTESQVEQARAHYAKLPNVSLKLDFFLPPTPFELIKKNRLIAPIEEYERWRPRLLPDFDIFVPDPENGVAVHKVMAEGEPGAYCTAITNCMTIDTDGSVSCCCNIDFDDFSPENEIYFGTLFEHGSALAAFHSERAEAFRNKYWRTNGQFGKCANCRHNMSVREKQPMEQAMQKYDYKTMISGIART